MKTLFFLISTLVVLFTLSCSSEKPDTTDIYESICVKTTPIILSQKQIAIEYPGILSSRQISKLSFKTGGIIDKIYVDEGSRVQKGQLIATLNMTEISSQVDQAYLAYEKAERDLRRIKNLFKDTVATLEQLQDATSAFEIALENKKIAEFNKQYSKITAPSDGRIISRLAEEHELISPGMPVIVFSEGGREEWVVKAGLSDKDIVKIKIGDKSEAVFDAYPEKVFKASVSKISEMADPLSGTFTVEVKVDAQNERLINGLVAKIIIHPLDKQSVSMVPTEAITQADGDNAFVYVVEKSDTTAKKLPVKIGYVENDFVAIVEGLDGSCDVITEGASYVKEGSKVTIEGK